MTTHLAHLIDRRGSHDEPLSSPIFRGGQRAADAALARFTVEGYQARKPAIYPQPERGASQLSPWIRHGLLSLRQLWDHVENGPPPDVAAFRSMLLAQERARHNYARLSPWAPGSAAGPSARAAALPAQPGGPPGLGWDRRLACIQLPLDEMEQDGWLVDGARHWLAHYWLSNEGSHQPGGEDHFFRHLLDGSRAVNRVAWRAASAAAAAPAGSGQFVLSRWQVERRAPGLCASCELVHACPIDHEVPFPGPNPTLEPVAGHLVDADDRLDAVAEHLVDLAPLDDLGPATVVVDRDREAEAIWLTAESLGDADPALAAHPQLPAVFVFDQPLLTRLRLSAKRLVFLTETLSDLATRRPVEIWLGSPPQVLADRALAVTFTPVPGWRRRSAVLQVVSLHPWSWLIRPLSCAPERSVRGPDSSIDEAR